MDEIKYKIVNSNSHITPSAFPTTTLVLSVGLPRLRGIKPPNPPNIGKATDILTVLNS